MKCVQNSKVPVKVSEIVPVKIREDIPDTFSGTFRSKYMYPKMYPKKMYLQK